VLITVLPRNYTFEGSPEKSIMSAAREAGFRWPTICGGNADCGVCFIRVADEDVGALSPITALEKAGLEMVLPVSRSSGPACCGSPARPGRAAPSGYTSWASSPKPADLASREDTT
jgi:ferredoxin, 2Fe-2S